MSSFFGERPILVLCLFLDISFFYLNHNLEKTWFFGYTEAPVSYVIIHWITNKLYEQTPTPAVSVVSGRQTFCNKYIAIREVKTFIVCFSNASFIVNVLLALTTV